MSDNQHLHNKIGNAVGECKRRLYDRLKTAKDIQTEIARFMAELDLALEVALRDE